MSSEKRRWGLCEVQGKGLTDVGLGDGGLGGGHRDAWTGVPAATAATAVPALTSSPRKLLRNPDERQGPGLDSIGLQTILCRKALQGSLLTTQLEKTAIVA